MSTSVDRGETAPTVVVPARAPVRPKSGRKGWAVVVLIGLAALALGLASRSDLVRSRLLGRVVSSSTVYRVGPVDLSVTLRVDGDLMPRESLKIKNEVEGEATVRFVVAESSRVKAGDLLVELASDELQEWLDGEQITLIHMRTAAEAAQEEQEIILNENASTISKAELDLEVAELDLRQYTEGEYARQLKDAEISITQAKMDIEQKADELEKSRLLAEKGYVTQMEIAQLKFELERARMTLIRDELARVILEQYEAPKTRTQKQSAVDQARKELERERKRAESRARQAAANVEEQTANLRLQENRVQRMTEQLKKCKIFAPADGVVQYPSDDSMFSSSGRPVAPGDKVFTNRVMIEMPDMQQILVRCRIPEMERSKVKPGMNCLVRVRAVPGEVYNGTLTKIAMFADSADRRYSPEKEHTAEIALDTSDPRLAPGDSADIEIQIDELRGVLAAPVQCVISHGSKRYVFVDRNGAVAPVEVQTGRSTASMTEIRDGLKPGDVIHLSVDDSMMAMLPDLGELQSEAAPPPPMAASPRSAPGGGGGAPPAPPGGGRGQPGSSRRPRSGG